MAAAEVVEAMQQERKELECKGLNRESSKQHHYDQGAKTAIIGSYAQIDNIM